jgi:hypothetical protein
VRPKTENLVRHGLSGHLYAGISQDQSREIIALCNANAELVYRIKEALQQLVWA